MKAYTSVAEYYDRLNDGVDYEKWADFLALELGEVRSVLDLACGTGNMTFALEARGYDMIGCDLSCDMLAKAREKAEALSSRALFLQQDMTALDLYGTVGGVVSCLDSINYLLSCDALYMCFSGVYKFLEKGGVFIFDVNSAYRLRHLNEMAFTREFDRAFCVYHSDFSEKTKILTYTLDLFEREGRLYRRSTEYHHERAYEVQELTELLLAAGFTDVEPFGDCREAPPAPDEGRIFFLAKT